MLNNNSPASGIACATTAEGVLVTIWGEVDVTLRPVAAEVVAQVGKAIADSTPVIIDASDLTFIDSSGVAFILQLYSLGQGSGSQVSLRDPSPTLVEVLDMVGIGERIPVISVG